MKPKYNNKALKTAKKEKRKKKKEKRKRDLVIHWKKIVDLM